MLLSMLSVVFLPRQFQVMVVENVREEPPAPRGLGVSALPAAHQPVRAAHCTGRPAVFRAGARQCRDLCAVAAAGAGQHALALLAFVGGLSAATGMVIVEAMAVSTMVCNDLVLPLLLRWRHLRSGGGQDLTRCCWASGAPPFRGRAAAGLCVLSPRGRGLRAGQHRAHQLCRGGAVCTGGAGRHVLEGRHPAGALAGLLAGFLMWAYTLMLPSLPSRAGSTWAFCSTGPGAWPGCGPSSCLACRGWTA
jgi:Na+/proline symporter